jgi:hypothetical protein
VHVAVLPLVPGALAVDRTDPAAHQVRRHHLARTLGIHSGTAYLPIQYEITAYLGRYLVFTTFQ